ncbi:MAG: glutamate racemase [Anaerovorax sp.]
MDNRPIGFFDSGLGGLTCIPHLMKALPNERIIYFGDTARTPYGSKDPATITHFSLEIADFLVKNQVKMIVIACNTVSSTCLYTLREKYPDLPVLGIISPAARTIARICDPSNIIGIIGTKVTIKSHAYEKKVHSLNDQLEIHAIPCPTFVPLIEEGIIQNQIMDLSIKYYLDGFISYNKIDTLVLGCTHYPLIRDNISKLYPHLQIIDPSKEILQSITDSLGENHLLSDAPTFENTFYASDLSENFVNMINKIFENSNLDISFKIGKIQL